MTVFEQSPDRNTERKWKQIVIWTVAVLDLGALAVILWTW